MYKYGHRTRGHPKVQRLLALMTATVVLITSSPPDLAWADSNIYTNHIDHWAGGFKHGEGTNSWNGSFNIGLKLTKAE